MLKTGQRNFARRSREIEKWAEVVKSWGARVE
jgi:hypothetical protein